MTRIPDVIVLDLFMPQMDGVKVLEVMRSYLRLQTLRVVVLTAFPESPLVKSARELGVTRILAKSRVTFDQIREAVQAELDDTIPPGDNLRPFFTRW